MVVMRRTLVWLLGSVLTLFACGGGVVVEGSATSTTVPTAPSTATTVPTTSTASATTSTVGDSEAVDDGEDEGDYDYGGYDDGPAATTLPAATGESGGATATVGAENFAFSPATVEVKVGDTVQWVLREGSHTTTSGTTGTSDGNWNEVITADAPVSISFDEPGEFRFFCRFHPDTMQGTIVVQD